MKENFGQIITLSGVAGIGKSRFISEMRSNYCCEKNILWLEGRCLSYCKNSSFWPFTILLKDFANINENDEKNIILEKLFSKLLDVFHDKANNIIPFIAIVIVRRK